MILQWWIRVHGRIVLVELGLVLRPSQCSELNHGQVLGG